MQKHVLPMPLFNIEKDRFSAERKSMRALETGLASGCEPTRQKLLCALLKPARDIDQQSLGKFTHDIKPVNFAPLNAEVIAGEIASDMTEPIR
jgi:hypothetical protein